MKCIHSFATFAVIFCFAERALSVQHYSNKDEPINSTGVAALKEQIAKLINTYETSLFSAHPQTDCLANVAPLEDDLNADELMSIVLQFLRNCNTTEISNVDFGNQLMDTVLEYLRHIIRTYGLARVSLPDFSDNGFKGWNGFMEDTTSITRKGTTTVEMENTHLVLNSTLGLNDFRLGYDYSGRVFIFTGKGKIWATVKTNALSFSVDLNILPGNCGVKLRHFGVDELGDIDVEISGLNILGVAKKKIVKKFREAFEIKIRDALEGQVREMIIQKLNDIKCPQ